jgi:hypothetical protein
LDHIRRARSIWNGPTAFLSWLEIGKVVGVADEHTAEQIRSQQSIELGRAEIFPGVTRDAKIAFDLERETQWLWTMMEVSKQ